MPDQRARTHTHTRKRTVRADVKEMAVSRCAGQGDTLDLLSSAGQRYGVFGSRGRCVYESHQLQQPARKVCLLTCVCVKRGSII